MHRFLTAKITRGQLDPFIKKYQSDEYTLDLGCSDSPYASLFPNRLGVDISEGKGVDVVADAHALPMEDNTFDTILCTEVLEHLHTPAKAISEMKRVLKPGGTLILTTRFVFPLHDTPHDYFRYTKYGLLHLLEGWDVKELQEEADTMETLAVLVQRIGYQTQLRCNKISKILLFLMAKLISKMSFLVKKEYGDIERKEEVGSIMTSGYYVVCMKPKSN